MIGDLAPQAVLLRGFATDFLTSHDEAEVERIMDPAYCLSIGGFLLDGRDDSYFPATAAQLAQFPGLSVTVHDAIIGTDHVAMRFTEHGASVRDGGRVAAWGGVTLFRIADGRLAEGWAEEDYFARKRQLIRACATRSARPARHHGINLPLRRTNVPKRSSAPGLTDPRSSPIRSSTKS